MIARRLVLGVGGFMIAASPLLVARGAEPGTETRLSICYNVQVAAEEFEAFNLIVVDSAYPDQQLKRLKRKDAVVLGYLSLGAVDRGRWWYSELAEAKALRGRNPAFDSVQIDLQNPAWQTLVQRKIIPQLLEKGFDGVFLDDLDLIHQNKQHALVAPLLREIRRRYPRIKLMANRGLEYLPSFASQVDYVLLESCVAENGKLRPQRDLQWALDHLKSGRKSNPRLVACALDYYGTTTIPRTPRVQELIRSIRQVHAAHQLVSCISVARLNTVPVTAGTRTTDCVVEGVVDERVVDEGVVDEGVDR